MFSTISVFGSSSLVHVRSGSLFSAIDRNIGGIAPYFVSVAIENLLCIADNILYNDGILF
jgi:hypothetical protein